MPTARKGSTSSRTDEYGRNVFINCPFDSEFRPLFDAIVFAVRSIGFRPRCALEISDSGQVRIEKIVQIIRACRLGIHDLSRTELDQVANLPRFNMPLELGLFLGALKFGDRSQKSKRCLIVDRDRYRYQKFCSDLSGHDIEAHSDDELKLVTIVRDWLQSVSTEDDRLRERDVAAECPPLNVLPSGVEVARRFGRYRAESRAICSQLGLDQTSLSYADFDAVLRNWLRGESGIGVPV